MQLLLFGGVSAQVLGQCSRLCEKLICCLKVVAWILLAVEDLALGDGSTKDSVGLSGFFNVPGQHVK